MCKDGSEFPFKQHLNHRLLISTWDLLHLEMQSLKFCWNSHFFVFCPANDQITANWVCSLWHISIKSCILCVCPLTHWPTFLLLTALRAPALRASQGRELHLAAAQRGLQWQRLQQLTGCWSDQDRQVGHRPSGPAACLRLHALHLSDRLYPGESHLL